MSGEKKKILVLLKRFDVGWKEDGRDVRVVICTTVEVPEERPLQNVLSKSFFELNISVFAHICFHGVNNVIKASCVRAKHQIISRLSSCVCFKQKF